MAYVGLKTGDEAPDFTLPGVDGKDHSLGDYAQKRVLVIIFTCNHCPYAQAYEDRLIELANFYSVQAVQFVAICPNDSIEKHERSQPSAIRTSSSCSMLVQVMGCPTR